MGEHRIRFCCRPSVAGAVHKARNPEDTALARTECLVGGAAGPHAADFPHQGPITKVFVVLATVDTNYLAARGESGGLAPPRVQTNAVRQSSRKGLLHRQRTNAQALLAGFRCHLKVGSDNQTFPLRT
jgi:hypothetical protein